MLPWQLIFERVGEDSVRFMLRKTVCLSFLLSAWLIFSVNTAQAENLQSASGSGPLMIDCSDSQHAYGETVAAYNQQAERFLSGKDIGPNDGRRTSLTALYPVLCQTYDADFDFSEWEPECVIIGPQHCCTLYYATEEAAEKAAALLSCVEGIRYAERDSAVEACAEGVPDFQSWGAESMSYGEYLRYCGGIQSDSATVAVVDSGIWPHPVLADRILESGYDYIDGDNDATNDLYGHGTNVGGIIRDCTQGFRVYLYPIKVLNATGGGSVSNTINGIREATDRGVDIINLSLAAKKSSEALNSAVIDALGAGITVVVAAGNASADTAQFSPANLSNVGVVVVGSAEADGTRSSYSNYGSSVDVYAYGSDILCCSINGGYTAESGTSIAAPHVTALAALLTLTHKGIAPEEVETRICFSTAREAVINIPDLAGIIPSDVGFSLSSLKMELRDSIPLPVAARPAAAMESIRYQSSDSSVVSVLNGVLSPVGPGQAKITACCLGMPDRTFTVEVTGEDCTQSVLPQQLKRIDAGAFLGSTALMHVILPSGCESIAEDAFAECSALRTIEIPDSLKSLPKSFSDAVVICPANDALEAYLSQYDIPYIVKP